MTRALHAIDETHEVLRDLNDAVDNTVDMIRNDLDRARAVVRDATLRWSNHVAALRAAAADHRAQVESVSEVLRGRASESMLAPLVDEITRISREGVRITEQIGELAGRVDNIAGCADAIDGLARETRFIAFNARIETHRAGAAGRTFKVVADEVKRLANASSTLSNQIRQAVSDCHGRLAGLRSAATGLGGHDSHALEGHGTLLEAIAQLSQGNQSLEHMLHGLERSASEASLALQLEEMVSQHLIQAQQRVADLARCSLRAIQVLAEGHGKDRVGSLHAALDELRHAKDSASPVELRAT